MIRKAVLPVAGFGTRLLPMTKEMPKEMLPIFLDSINGGHCLKPIVQAIYEQLYDAGFREFGFIVGRGKRAIEDHFTPDQEFVKELERKNKAGLAEELKSFYNRVNDSTFVFINQPEPKGFGDAVLRAKSFINEVFLVHAGDTYIFSSQYSHIHKLVEKHENLKADATMLVREVEDPRIYGVIEGDEVELGTYRVKKVVEKPDKPQTNLAIVPIYVFNPVIFKALEATPQGKGGEIQLTDGIQKMIEWGLKVYAVKLPSNGMVVDIGNPESCWEAFKLSYQNLKRSKPIKQDT
jgi:UTP--glucose-1-phosphate uridylyltransferase